MRSDAHTRLRFVSRALLLLLIALTPCSVALAHEEVFIPDRPKRVTLRIEGRSTPLRGSVTRWAFGAFWVQREGSDVSLEIPWSKLQPRIAYETARGLIDRDDAIGYFRLGIEMLQLDDERLAERAFKYAIGKAPWIEEHTLHAKGFHGDGRDPGRAYRDMLHLVKQDAEEALEAIANLPPPPVDDAQAVRGVEPWKALDVEAFERALELQREFVRTTGHERGDPKRLTHETDHFIIATDMTERDLMRWSQTLEEMYATMLDTLELPEGKNLFAGKAMVFLFGSREAFLKFEQVGMGVNANRAGGLCHYRGENVILSFYRWGSDADFQSVLVHESVHGVLYRYRTPASLPTWANEGLADYIAGRLTPDSNEPRQHWTHVRAAIAGGLDPKEIMEQSYANGRWYTDDSYPTSHMLVRFLIKYKPREFKQWIDLIKAGKPWEDAMGEAFGIDADMLARGFVDEIRSESTYRAP